jgi:hypothetical protein
MDDKLMATWQIFFAYLCLQLVERLSFIECVTVTKKDKRMLCHNLVQHFLLI